MRLLLLTLILCCFIVAARAQSVDYNRVILPDHLSDVEFEEKLVQLAWKNHPSNKVVYNDLRAAQYETKIASSAWLDMVRLSGNLNEFNLESGDDPRSQFFPRYNIGLVIPLGAFQGMPARIKRGRELEEIAMHNINEQKLAIRATVLKLYNSYLMYREIFNIRSQELEEASASFLVTEQRFKAGQESYDKYSAGLHLLNRIKIERVTAQTDYLNAKLSIEEYIGVRLEDVK